MSLIMLSYPEAQPRGHSDCRFGRPDRRGANQPWLALFTLQAFVIERRQVTTDLFCFGCGEIGVDG